MFIFREEVDKQGEPDLQGKAKLVIAKQHNGPTGRVNLVFIKYSTRFESMATDMGPEKVRNFP